MNKYIDRMGVELEGGWHEPPQRLQGDGSVRGTDCPHIGESISPPYERFDKLVRFMEDNHPDVCNSTCGLHVHFSFNSVAFYSMLMDRGFQDHFYRVMKTWGTKAGAPAIFWERLEGRNTYCLKEWDADNQAGSEHKGGVRYRHWNYCYLLHGTAECRMLPMFKQLDMGIEAVRAVKHSVITWLRRCEKLKAEIVETITEPLPQAIETAQPETITENV